MNHNTNITKKAASKLNLLNPFYTLAAGDASAVAGLPRLMSDPQANLGAWNAIGTLGTGLTLGAALKLVSGAQQRVAFDRKKQRAIRSKMNAVSPITSPDMNLDDDASEEAKRTKDLEALGLVSKKASSKLGVLGRMFAISAPLAAAGGGLYLGSKLIDDGLHAQQKEDLDAKILRRRNELNAAYAEIVQLARGKQGKGKQSASVRPGRFNIPGTPVAPVAYQEPSSKEQEQEALLDKTASGLGSILNAPKRILAAEPILSEHDTGRGAVDVAMDIPLLSLMATTLLAGYASKKYFDKRDKYRKRMDLMENEVLPANTTHQLPQLIHRDHVSNLPEQERTPAI